MSTRKQKQTVAPPRLGDVCRALRTIAPLELAQPWDNVGLLAGDEDKPVRKAALCIDLTCAVADEAVTEGIDLVVAYHPPIFKPVARLTAQSKGPERFVFRCISSGIAVYSMHTALDAADGGTCDVLASLCGITRTEPLVYARDVGESECKIVTFVPPESADAVAEAMFAAGAGRIGDYSKCSYRLEGYGTFLGAEQTSPAVGRAGRFERVAEVRLEMVCPSNRIPPVTAALVASHPYEEPAYDIYPVKLRPVRGIGRYGSLGEATRLADLARRLKDAASAPGAQIVGDGDREVSRAVIVVGAAGALPFAIPLTDKDVIVTGEMRHHDALTVLRYGCSAIVLNHWTSERPALHAVGQRLGEMVAGVDVRVSDADCEPFRPV